MAARVQQPESFWQAGIVGGSIYLDICQSQDISLEIDLID